MSEETNPELTAEERARDQFAALGRFIQGFEDIVSLLRWHCHQIMLGAQLGIGNPDAKVMLQWFNITSLIFHHESITANPLLAIWRSLLAEQCEALKCLGILSEKGEKVAKGVSVDIANEFASIHHRRNTLVHATWRIGFWSPFEDFPDLGVEKYKVGVDGFTKRTDLPKSFDELFEWGDRCHMLSGKLGRFIQFFHYQPKDIESVFVFEQTAEKGQKWKFVPPTQPPKSPDHPS
jgi:hypothetical protein